MHTVKTYEKIMAVILLIAVMCTTSWAIGARAGAKHAIENAEIVSTEEVDFNLLPLYWGIGGRHLYK